MAPMCRARAKVLTIIAATLNLLGSIASLFGMNFDRTSPFKMPELGWFFGYPARSVVF